MDGAARGFSIGIDIGGTFTDVVCAGEGRTLVMKVPSTRSDPSRAVAVALERLAREEGIEPASIARFAHGTTVATNAVLERKGAKLGLITTAGFRDVLEIGRQLRRQMYELRLQPETPVFLAPRARRVEVAERAGPKGEVLVALTEAEVERAWRELKEQGVEAIAVAFLFSFLAPAHELLARDVIRRLDPDMPVSLSHEVDPAFREYERTTVTAFDAYVKPVVDRYLAGMEGHLTSAGVPASLRVMQSRGGLAAAGVARQRPVRLFLSGPAAGVVGGSAAAALVGETRLVTIDVGGTSSDIALIDGGEALVRGESDIAGYPVRVPMVDVTTLGAGGGSLVWLDSGGGLRVGPESAGAEPGPACYGRGGSQATVTDASLVLGYLDPEGFAGGSLRLDPTLAAAAVDAVAVRLGLTREETALGIHRVANAQMAEGIRQVSIRRGFDPREFALVALGGGGPLHGPALAEELGITRVLIPRHPGVLSAAGLLAAPVEHEISAAFHRPLAGASLAELAEAFAALDREVERLMALERLTGPAPERRYSADICYIGQSFALEVPIELGRPDALERLYRGFLAAHERVNGHSREAPTKLVNLRAVHRAPQVGLDLAAVSLPETPAAPLGRRPAFFPGFGQAQETLLWDRAALVLGQRLQGPAVVAQSDTTVLIPPDWQAEVAAGGTLVLSPEG